VENGAVDIQKKLLASQHKLAEESKQPALCFPKVQAAFLCFNFVEAAL